MNIARVDLNLLVYLDVLLRERNVTKAANHLGISQPAMSNGLRRLREMFDDPILVRTSEGMTPTERAHQLQPLIRELLSSVEKAVEPQGSFDPASSDRAFRIMASDYAESTLIPILLDEVMATAPNITLDIMTPSDVSFLDVEQGRVDMVINRFDSMPQSFHQVRLWEDDFCCLLSIDNPILNDFTLDSYLASHHVWVSKTGMGAGVGMSPKDVQRLGWVDEALNRLGKSRNITLFTRHYQAAMLLAEKRDLVVTIPRKAAQLYLGHPRIQMKEPPFEIPPFALTMAWSPLLQHNPAHQWLRRLIQSASRRLDEQELSVVG